jgi:hypothetical protein
MTSINAILAATTLATATFAANATAGAEQVHHRSVNIQDVNVFYREAGPTSAPKVLLLHALDRPQSCPAKTSPTVSTTWLP